MTVSGGAGPNNSSETARAVPIRARLSNGTSWPLPDLGDGEGLGWNLLYGKPTSSDLARAASIISAYGYLIALPRDERQLVVRELREAIR